MANELQIAIVGALIRYPTIMCIVAMSTNFFISHCKQADDSFDVKRQPLYIVAGISMAAAPKSGRDCRTLSPYNSQWP